MRGFLVGSLILIAVEVFLTGTGPDKASGLIGWSADVFNKVLSPDHPGIPQVKTAATTTTAPSSATTVPGAGTGLSAVTV